jgi:hypothetical protein
MLQGCTVRFLAHLVQGCSVEGEALIEGMLRLALELDWWKLYPQLVLLAALLIRRLADAADAGAFSSPNSPLASMASTLACKLLSATGKPCPPIIASCHCVAGWTLVIVVGIRRVVGCLRLEGVAK